MLLDFCTSLYKEEMGILTEGSFNDYPGPLDFLLLWSFVDFGYGCVILPKPLLLPYCLIVGFFQ